jgi:uncharacterized membrane protein YbhN (UPF0104 family)
VIKTRVRKALVQNLVTYTIAGGIVYYASRGVSWRQVAEAGDHVTIWSFIVASMVGFLCWFIGETVLYSRLFSYFHGRTEERELLPTMAAVYFLQIINSYVAGGAFILFLHVRKQVGWLTAGCTLMFQGYLDALLLAALSLVAIALVPTSPIRLGLNYAAGIMIAGGVIASFWLVWGSQLSSGRWLRWLYERPSMVSFRLARPSQYIMLMGIRSLIVVGAGLALYGQFVSFHIRVPLFQILALTPFIVAIGNSPLSPGGIGTTQLVFTMAFSKFAVKDELFALSLAVTAFNLAIRIPLGFAMGRPLAREAIEVEHELAAARRIG